MKTSLAALFTILIVVAGFFLVIRFTGSETELYVTVSQAKQALPNHLNPPFKLPAEQVESGLNEESGEAHSMALDVIMEWIEHQLVLTEEDRDVMLAFLAQSRPQNMTAGDWQERVNEILNFLRSQPSGVPGLSDLLVKMTSNDPDPVIRMYALQHIALWVPDEPDAKNKEQMISFLERLAGDSSDSLAGSAVIFLNDLDCSGDLPSRFDTAELIDRAAMRLVADKSARPDVRICALHAGAARGIEGIVPESRNIALDSTLMVPLRKAAIYSLGEVGATEDIEFLESLSNQNPVLEPAIQPAIRRIEFRKQQL